MREYLDIDFGIDERRIQNLIIQDPKQPFTEDELAEISGALHSRPAHELAVDKGKKAKTVTRDTKRWAKNPNRLDIQGIDTPNAKNKHLEALIDILSKVNDCSRKRACGTPESVRKTLEGTGKYDKRDLDRALEAAREAGYFE